MKNKWVLKVSILSFFLSAIFSGLSTYISDFNVIFLFIILFLVIGVGIVFDMIGVAVLTASEAPFHAMSAKKNKVASSCIKMLKSSAQISSICNDVVGDICGIVSGSLGAALAIYLSMVGKLNIILSTILVTSFISSLTVGGKALFKKIATKKNEKIVLIVGKILRVFKY